MDSHWTSSCRGWGLTFGTDEPPACFHRQHCQMQQPNEESGGEVMLEHDQFLYMQMYSPEWLGKSVMILGLVHTKRP